jgi:hypothetical protein
MKKRTLGGVGKTNPIQTQNKANTKPIQSQNKPNTNPICRGEAGTNPISAAKNRAGAPRRNRAIGNATQ